MFLTEANVLQYLLERRFADLESVVDGAFQVLNLSRRNRNFQVSCGAREYFIKQPKKWDAQSRRSLEHEAAIYWQTKTDTSFQPLRDLVPESYGDDPANSVLTLQYLTGHINLRRIQDRFAPILARLAGAAMGAFHRDMRAFSGSSLFTRRKPWYLFLLQAGVGEQEDSNEGRRELVRVVQKHSDFEHALGCLRDEWREETVIHGDWKLKTACFRLEASASR